MELKRRKESLRLATMDDFDWINDLFRKKHKKHFPHIFKDTIKERICSKCVFVSNNKKYAEIIRIYKKKTKIGTNIIANKNDIRLSQVAAVKSGEGIGTKYRMIFLKQMFLSGRKFFSTVRYDNETSKHFYKKCGFLEVGQYKSNSHKYVVYVYICKGKNFKKA